MASSCKKNSQSNLPSSLSVWSWQTLQAWPGMRLLAEVRLCLSLGSHFAFLPEDFQDLRRVHEYVNHFISKSML